MKKHLLLLFSLLFLISCSSDDDTTANEPETTVAFNLDATGTVADQTAEEAKETINGRWSIGSSSSKGTSSKGQSCSLNYIEFTDSKYGISIGLSNGEDVLAFGNYSMIETNNTVSAVELYVSVLGNNHLIATLTNIVVTENANELNAVFDVVFNIPADYDWACGTSLSGNYTADKEEPLSDAVDADPNSNFAKIVNTWLISEVYDIEDGQRIDIIEDVNEICYEVGDDYTCVQGSVELTFTAYGTYLMVYYFPNGDIEDYQDGEWEFSNSEKTTLLVTEQDYEYTSQFYVEISNIDESVFEGSISEIEEGQTYYVQEFVFTKVTN